MGEQMYLLTVSLHKEPVSNSQHASIAQKGPTTVDEVRMWSWPNLRYYPEIHIYRGSTKTHETCVSILSRVRQVSETDSFRQKIQSFTICVSFLRTVR